MNNYQNNDNSSKVQRRLKRNDSNLNANSPPFIQKSRSNSPVESNNISTNKTFPVFTPTTIKKTNKVIYLPKRNIVTSFDEDGVQRIGILLNKKVLDKYCTNYWLQFFEDHYDCKNIRSNFNFDGFSVFSVYNLNKINNFCPFHIKWVKTNIYTSNSFDICRINRGGIVSEEYIFDNDKYQKNYEDNQYCNYILKCEKCNIIFEMDERCDKCRWCSS